MKSFTNEDEYRYLQSMKKNVILCKETPMITSMIKNINNMAENEFGILENVVKKKRKIIDIEKISKEIKTEIKKQGFCILTKQRQMDVECVQCLPIKFNVIIEAFDRGGDFSDAHFEDVAEKEDQYEWVKLLRYDYEGDGNDLAWKIIQDKEWKAGNWDEPCQGFGEAILYLYTNIWTFDAVREGSSIIEGIFESKYYTWYVGDDGIFEIKLNRLYNYSVKQKLCELNEKRWNEFCQTRSIIHLYDVTENDDLELDWSEFNLN